MRVTGSTKQNSSNPFILGVSGGSGSGKTYFAHALANRLGRDKCTIISQDSFYIDQSKRVDHDGGSVNFDHPDAIDFTLLARAIRELKSNLCTQVPIYDFVTHSRLAKTIPVEPTRLIIIDGILILHSDVVRCEFHDTIFVDTPEAIRYQRRLDRDVRERGRTPEGVRAQFLNQVKPMHDAYVEPSKTLARTVISEDAHFHEVLEEAVRRFASS